MKALGVLLLALLASPAWAQTRQPAQITTLPTTSPQEFDLLDNTGKWMPLGAASGGVFTISSGPYDVRRFGAKCDGTTDDTTAFNTALVSANLITIPPGKCEIGGTLAFAQGSQHLVGSGVGATTLEFTGTGTGDALQIGSISSPANCIGATRPANCATQSNFSVSRLTITATARTGGYLFNVSDASNVAISDVTFNGWLSFQLRDFNNVLLANMNGYCAATAGACFNIVNPVTAGTAAGWYRSDVAKVSFVTVNAQSAGANCINIDGMVQTVTSVSWYGLNCFDGLVIQNSAASTSAFPEFWQSTDLELDGGKDQGVQILGGRYFNFDGGLVNVRRAAATGHYALVIQPDSPGSTTSQFKSNSMSWGPAPGAAASINVKEFVSSGDSFLSNSLGNGTEPGMFIFGVNSYGIVIQGASFWAVGGNTPTYGVQIDAAQTGSVSLVGNNYENATIGDVKNNSNHAISYVGGLNWNHNSIRVNGCVTNSVCNTLPYSVAGTPLGTCDATGRGVFLMVTDATSPTYNAPYTGSGVTAVPVVCDGATWRTH